MKTTYCCSKCGNETTGLISVQKVKEVIKDLLDNSTGTYSDALIDLKKVLFDDEK